ncbi:hypothetical protein Glove_150g92 [Diversispora epigaea]|uniref:Uncharacterized protein n=1 Tax=Diversispora epigaea TaxID=1348612 RepID=A0A397IY17_9GLOM|nr:hypothetical protein Glove_150g92 [Diversispora epigaea]
MSTRFISIERYFSTTRNISPKGCQLGSIYEEEPKEKLYNALKSKIKRDFDRDLKRANSEIQKLYDFAIQLINEVKRFEGTTDLLSQLSCERISHTEYKTKYETQLKDIKSLQSNTKKLEGKKENLRQYKKKN